MSNDQYYGGQQPDPYAGGQRPYDPYAGGQQDPEVTQTWEGQTWDTQYQPAVRPQGEQPHGEQRPGPPSYGEQQPYAPQSYGGQGHEPRQAYGQQPYGERPQAYGEQPQAQPYGQQSYEQQQPYAGAYQPQQSPAPAPAPAPVSAAPVVDDGPAYSPPTTSGNTRITDAQRARAEGRSPIIEPGMQPAALTAVLGLLIAGGAALGPYGLLLPLVLLQGLTAAGWFRLNGMWPARQGIALAFLGGLVADGALLVVGRENAAPAILGTLGVWVLLCLVLQLRSHADPDERMYGLMATVASAALTVIATGHLGAAPDAVVVGGAAVAAAVLAKALPLPGPVPVVAALLAAAGAGIAAGGLTDLGASGALLGLGAGICALVGLRAASYDYPSRFVHMTAGVALPLTAAAPAVYLLGRALA
ncbi:hypothetical protein [Streptomyces sp. cmx-4-7]|uniref:hypothetical protein n=1 Tax=Streptomyces sp. cmx-4-7 TaxID=2790939 RepID=UPI00397F89FF